MQAGPSLLTCDGCGAAVNEAHLRRRVERLELATRFRPIHIQVLLLDLAPPSRLADFFYHPIGQPFERSTESRNYFEGLMAGAGIPQDSWKDEQSALSEFQRRGLFLAYAVECPYEEAFAACEAHGPGGLAGNVVRLFGPTVLKRIQFSYKPRHIALLNPGTSALVPLLEQAGWGSRLVLDRGLPLADSSRGDSRAQSEFGAQLGKRLAELLPKAT